MELSILDWVILAVVAFFTVSGLFMGFSGQFGSIVGIVFGLAVGYLLFAPIKEWVVAAEWVSSTAANNAIACVSDFVVILVTFGVVRKAVAKFVSFLVPQPMNAIAGGAVGFVKASLALGVLSGIGFIQTGRFAEGFFAEHSNFVEMAGRILDFCVQG